MDRGAGVLLHISSLPSKYGIGDFGSTAFRFIDFLHENNFKYWQILPLGVTGFGNSPYQTLSAFGGNPLFIDLENLIQLNLISKKDIPNIIFSETQVDYDKVKIFKEQIFKIAFENFYKTNDEKFLLFIKKNSFWLDNFSLFLTLKENFSYNPWKSWPKKYKFHSKKDIQYVLKKYSKDILYQKFLQYLFHSQWDNIKKYAHEKNIKIIGDIPFYVSGDSSDTWRYTKYFSYNKYKKITKVGGVPPDNFSKNGQLWGIPTYNWKSLKKHNYLWWKERIKYSFKLYDIIRLDHFRGFESFWSISSKSKTAKNGEWCTGPNFDFFNSLRKDLNTDNTIAEDLGFLTSNVKKLLNKTNFPGMNILEFAFDFNENNQYLPHKFIKNSVSYIGTHDNQTFEEWKESLSEELKNYSKEYLKNFIKDFSEENIYALMVKSLLVSDSNVVIFQMQDLLSLGKFARMNTPGTTINNWIWMLENNYENNINLNYKELITKYCRI